MVEEAREATGVLASGRLLLGAAFCLAPSLAGRWAGEAADAQGTRMVVRSVGARDAVLGLGTLASLDEPAQLRRWLVASSVCDATDLAATAAVAGVGLAILAGR